MEIQEGAHWVAVKFPKKWPGRKFINNCILVVMNDGVWSCRRWELDTWAEVGTYPTKEEAMIVAQMIYDMGLFSR